MVQVCRNYSAKSRNNVKIIMIIIFLEVAQFVMDTVSGLVLSLATPLPISNVLNHHPINNNGVNSEPPLITRELNMHSLRDLIDTFEIPIQLPSVTFLAPLEAKSRSPKHLLVKSAYICFISFLPHVCYACLFHCYFWIV